MIWIIYDDERLALNNAFAQMLKAQCESCGFGAKILLKQQVAQQKELPKVAIMRIVDNALSKQLEKKGVRVVNNSDVSKICNDKFATLQFAKSFGVEIMPSKLIAKEDICGIDFSKSYVLKSLDGHGGLQVFMVKNVADAKIAFDKIAQKQVLLQDVASDLGKDARTYVLGGKIICTMLRTSTKDFRSNFCLGGQAQQIELPTNIANQVITMAKAMDADFVGVDYIYNNDKMIFNEIEDVVGCRMLYAKTNFDMAKMFVDYIVCKYLN
ncbi:MAG: ATP-grasp domain-containing protein [Clostridia bacterium]